MESRWRLDAARVEQLGEGDQPTRSSVDLDPVGATTERCFQLVVDPETDDGRTRAERLVERCERIRRNGWASGHDDREGVMSERRDGDDRLIIEQVCVVDLDRCAGVELPDELTNRTR